uniref:C2H2-type domain-containing protein n=1 Tax=Trichobilharzia regenti TaxID=157069 RepID=A0AA85J221_TRIRE|nr:unnamed protein product [Trichobilharzia regenti]
MTVDYLSCGTCFVTFRLSDISMFIEHKKASCLTESSHPSNKRKRQSSTLSLTTPAKPLLPCNSPPLSDITNKNINGCNEDHNANTAANNNNDNKHESENDVFTGILKCVQCLRQFTTPWRFLMHIQIEHQLIFVSSCGTSLSSSSDDDDDDDDDEEVTEEEVGEEHQQQRQEEGEQQQRMKLSCSDSEELSDDDVDVILEHTGEDEFSKEANNCNSNPVTTIAATTTATTAVHEMSNVNMTTTTTTATTNPAISSHNSDNNNDSLSITTSRVDTSSSAQTNSASTQTHLIGIKQQQHQRYIPHRKRKYFNCCMNEPTIPCRKLTNLTCTSLKEVVVQRLPSSCCTNLSTDICPYSSNPIMNSNNNNNSLNSNVFVSDYCCTRSIVCKPTSCTNGLMNTGGGGGEEEEVLAGNTSSCTGTAVVSCCMRKVVCCNNTTSTSLPVYCSQVSKEGNSTTTTTNNDNSNSNTGNSGLKTTPLNKMLTCCPCSPKKLITSQSCEVQTDFDPEFSYSDYADLAMLLAATPTPTPSSPSQETPPLPPPLPPTTTTPISPSGLSPFQSFSSASSLSSSSSSEIHQKNELYENFQTESMADILKRYSDTCRQDDKHTAVQNNNTNPMNSDNNDNGNHSVTLTGLSSSLDLDLRTEPISASSSSSSSSSNIIVSSKDHQQRSTSLENLTVQWPKIVQTNAVTYPNNNNNNSINNSNSNNNNNDTVNRYYSDPSQRQPTLPLAPPAPPQPRRYICRECGTSFRQNVHLRKHIMVQHTKEKPYRCTYCDYTTVEKSHLTVHIRIHTGERPYSCRECGYSSAQNCTLKSHYLRKHPNNLIECHYCSELFFTELELSKHHRICRLSQR